ADPAYWHLPLVVGQDGRRLAKRHGDTRLGHYRRLGVGPQRILGLLGFWSGMLAERREADMDELARRFDIGRVPAHPVMFTAQDDRFLKGTPS
ncbi:MAG: tRNA glutamyl-Q(34) synthetase GluQRS, partial [Planctomycetota bacterium]